MSNLINVKQIGGGVNGQIITTSGSVVTWSDAITITGFTYTDTNNTLTINDTLNSYSAYINQMSGLTINSISSDDALKVITTGDSNTLTVYSDGTVGVKTTGSTAFDLEVNGTFGATSKSFVIPHQTQEGKKLVHGAIEGPEFGVYYRGKVDGDVIDLPEYWGWLVDEETISVQLTAIGGKQDLFVKEIKDNKVYINNGTCYFTVYGERKDIDKIGLIIEE